MSYRTLQLEHGGGALATLWLDRPGHGNAIDARMLDELAEAFAVLGANDAVRVIVLAARGPAFCHGIDSAGWQDSSAAVAGMQLADARLAALLETLHACAAPVVARVQGDCHGAGMALVAACDIALAAGQAGFFLGGGPDAVIIPWVARGMEKSAARRYLLTGERMSAFEAKQAGLVHEAVAADALDEHVNAIVGALLRTDRQAMTERRRLLRQAARKN